MLYFRILYCRIEELCRSNRSHAFLCAASAAHFLFSGGIRMRKIVAVFLAFVLVLSLAGCGDSHEQPIENADIVENSTESIISNEQEKIDTEVSKSDENLEKLSEEIYTELEKEIDETVAKLFEDMENLGTDIDSYQKYLENVEKIENYYTEIYENTKMLCVRMYEYSLKYAENILASNKTNDEKYNDLEVIYDNIYNDAGDNIYDLIYDDLFDDMYDLYYDGLFDEAYDNKEYSEYSEWLDAHSNEYNMWLDTHSDIYDIWLDTRSDIYDFWLDLRGEIWDDDIERANKIIEDFREDIEKLKEDIDDSYILEKSEKSENTSSVLDEKIEENHIEYIDGMRPEFKEAMDSYEAFFDEYCEFMKKYKENSTDLSLLADYANYMTQYVDTMSKLEKLGEDDLNDAELLYYIEVSNRISQKLLKAAY